MKKLSFTILCCGSIIAMFAVYCKCIDNAFDNAFDKSLARIEKQHKEKDKEDKSESDHQ